MIGIKDMKMPSNCHMCKFKNQIYCIYDCFITKDIIDIKSNTRPKRCPLEEIK